MHRDRRAIPWGGAGLGVRDARRSRIRAPSTGSDGVHGLDVQRSVNVVRRYVFVPESRRVRVGLTDDLPWKELAADTHRARIDRRRSSRTSTCATIVSPKSVIRGSSVPCASIPSAPGPRPAGAPSPDRCREQARASPIALLRSRTRRRARRRGGDDRDRDETRRPAEGRCRLTRHAPITRLVRRRSVQTRNSVRISDAVARRYDDRVDVERAERREQRLQSAAGCCARRAATSFRRSRTDESRPVRGSRSGTTIPLDVRKALLPGRILDHDRDDVPAMLDRGEPQSRATARG